MRKEIGLKDGDVAALVFDTNTGMLEVHDVCETEVPLIQAKMSYGERLELAQVLTLIGDHGA
jgi:hypothetical protein